ncbi:MAG: hypothetical protein KDD78_12865, partial [Caldilineaceae bacterium]|nr:hypothetical protein [Caldilineaceae bacterium]
MATVTLTVVLLTSLYTVFVFLPPVYRLPYVVAAADIPSSAAHFGQIMQPGVELVAADVPPQSLHPSDVVRATLYWRKTTDAQAIALVAPEIGGRAYHRIGSLPLSYHGNGREIDLMRAELSADTIEAGEEWTLGYAL